MEKKQVDLDGNLIPPIAIYVIGGSGFIGPHLYEKLMVDRWQCWNLWNYLTVFSASSVACKNNTGRGAAAECEVWSKTCLEAVLRVARRPETAERLKKVRRRSLSSSHNNGRSDRPFSFQSYCPPLITEAEATTGGRQLEQCQWSCGVILHVFLASDLKITVAAESGRRVVEVGG